MITYTNLGRQYASIREEILDATDRVYSSGIMVDGENTHVLETEIARRCNRKFAVSVNSGSMALYFAHSLRQGVHIIPAMSFVATLHSVNLAGQSEWVVDVDRTGVLNMDHALNELSKQHEMRPCALAAVNLYGNMFDFDRLHSAMFLQGVEDVLIIEDAAQSFGSKLNGKPSGSFGDVSILSFDPMKNLPNYGSGGMILTDDIDIARMASNFKDNGKYTDHLKPGTNTKMSEADCAQLLVKLGHFDAWQRRRREIAEYYTDNINCDVAIPVPVTVGTEHSWHKYVVQTPNMESQNSNLLQSLYEQGVECKRHYRPSLAFYAGANCPQANFMSQRVLSLPIYPELTDSEVETVVKVINNTLV